MSENPSEFMANISDHQLVQKIEDLLSRGIDRSDDLNRSKSITSLNQYIESPEQIEELAERFSGEGAVGRSLMLEWITQLPGLIPRSVKTLVITSLGDEEIPTPLRTAAAARLLRSLPDRAESIGQVIRPLTAKLTPLARLEQLRQLQHQLDRSDALDALIERRERKLKMDCPRCGVRLSLPEMILHLWHVHHLMFERGRVRGIARTVDELREEHSNSRDTSVLDRASLLAGEHGLRAWSATSDYSPDDIAPLLINASDHDAGLCPGCLAEIPQSIPPLVHAAILSNGRLSADGYRVEVGGNEWMRTLLVAEPSRKVRSGLDLEGGIGRRGVATIGSGFILIVAVVLAILFPKVIIAPIALVKRLLFLAAFLYLLIWLIRPKFSDANIRAVDAAWNYLLVRHPWFSDIRFATRLCRASYGIGDPLARFAALNKLITDSLASASPEHQALAAAAELLKVEDEAMLGRDRIMGIVDLIGLSFRGKRSGLFAEYICTCLIERVPQLEPGEMARLRILLIREAFAAGLWPRDLTELWRVAPFLQRVMSIEPHHRLGLFQAIWAQSQIRSWERIASADTVFELAQHAPNISRRLLLEHPDLLLYQRTEDSVEIELGPILICTRGISIGGVMVSDPEADIDVIDSARAGGLVLIFGTYQLPISRLPGGFIDTLKRWLRYRFTTLLPNLDLYLERSNPTILDPIRKPCLTRCKHCGTISGITAGKVGTSLTSDDFANP